MLIRKKYIILLSLLVIVMTLVLVTLKILSYRSLNQISINEIKKIYLENNERIYICRLTDATGPEWEVVGDEKGLFSNKKPTEQVIMKGNMLPFLFRKALDDLYLRTTFIVKVKVKAKRVTFTEGDPLKYRVLTAQKWYLLSDN